MAATSSSFSSSSMVANFSPLSYKPRLLWRGALHLPDGTALPGVAIVSHVQPSFTRAEAVHTPIPSVSSEAPPVPPLTLSGEQQDALGLSIEMVRHAPIKIAHVLEGLDRDERGALRRPTRLRSSDKMENNDGRQVSYEAAGGIRMYVDPAYPSTVAFMERIFCYEDDTIEDNGDPSTECASESNTKNKVDNIKSSRNVIMLCLDKSYRYMLSSEGEYDDVFSESQPSTLWGALHQSSTSAASEAVIIGIRTTSRSEQDSALEMHVGQKVFSRKAKEDLKDTTAGLPFVNLLRARPDDPAPRGLSHVLSAKYRIQLPAASGRSVSASSSVRGSQMGKDQIHSRSPHRSPPPSSLSSTTRDFHALSVPTLKRSSSTSKVASTKSNKRADKRAKSITTFTIGINKDKGEGVSTFDEESRKVEDRNRSLIKKLVHHQLLGKGLEKTDAEYLACFNPTCHGTALALKKLFRTELIDRLEAASIIERHLEMYL